MGRPLLLAQVGQVGPALPEPDPAVDELAHDVGVPGVPVGLGREVDEDLPEGDLGPLVRLDGGQRERALDQVPPFVRPFPEELVRAADLGIREFCNAKTVWVGES